MYCCDMMLVWVSGKVQVLCVCVISLRKELGPVLCGGVLRLFSRYGLGCMFPMYDIQMYGFVVYG
jgi:hypothetical protein